MTEPVRVIRSGAGRDKDTLLAVLGEEDGYVLVADGRRRGLAAPKKKNPRHVVATGMTLPREAIRSDKALRRALRSLRERMPADRGGDSAN